MNIKEINIFIRVCLFFYLLICLLIRLAQLNYSNGETPHKSVSVVTPDG